MLAMCISLPGTPKPKATHRFSLPAWNRGQGYISEGVAPEEVRGKLTFPLSAMKPEEFRAVLRLMTLMFPRKDFRSCASMLAKTSKVHSVESKIENRPQKLQKNR